MYYVLLNHYVLRLTAYYCNHEKTTVVLVRTIRLF